MSIKKVVLSDNVVPYYFSGVGVARKYSNTKWMDNSKNILISK